MRVGKSSAEEMVSMLAFFQRLEDIIQDGEFEPSDPLFGDYDDDLHDAVGKFVVEEWESFLSYAWGRFYWGFFTVLDTVIDPDLDYLALKDGMCE